MPLPPRNLWLAPPVEKPGASSARTRSRPTVDRLLVPLFPIVPGENPVTCPQAALIGGKQKMRETRGHNPTHPRSQIPRLQPCISPSLTTNPSPNPIAPRWCRRLHGKMSCGTARYSRRRRWNFTRRRLTRPSSPPICAGWALPSADSPPLPWAAPFRATASGRCAFFLPAALKGRLPHRERLGPDPPASCEKIHKPSDQRGLVGLAFPFVSSYSCAR
jgi:hypothetical protein